MCGRCEGTKTQLEKTIRERKRLPAIYKAYTPVDDGMANGGRRCEL